MFKYNRIINIYFKSNLDEIPLHSFTMWVIDDEREVYKETAKWVFNNISAELIEDIAFRVDIVEEETEVWMGV